MKKRKIIVSLIVFVIIIAITAIYLKTNQEEDVELVTIKSEKELEEIFEGVEYRDSFPLWKKIVTLPYSIIFADAGMGNVITTDDYINTGINSANFYTKSETVTDSIGSVSAESSKDYSTTNIQVENVDEADITKTDGDYIYSISENNVVITDVRDPASPKISSKISEDDDILPEDLMLYNNKLVVIYEKITSSTYSYYNENCTIVKIYDITSKEDPKEMKNYELQQPYYTSRCIDNKLYVISSGNLKKENDKIITYYKEDGRIIDPGFNNIHYIKDQKVRSQSLISMVDLDNINMPVKVNSYLMNIENAYVSENNIYLLNEKYEGYKTIPPVNSIFGIKGILGAFDEKYLDYSGKTTYRTRIYKFNILEDGNIKFVKKAGIEGRTINQFSIDEYEGNLRLAVYDNSGSRIVIFDEKMNEIGRTEDLAKGEKMYSSRFLGNKAYLVTYKTVDPLFVVDLSDSTNPKVLGKLKIPGYSTYLHPYDENHIIGIGMQTQEKVNRNSSGKVTSTTATITGMKMALFDVSNVDKPIQISETIIGDSRTTSAILTNHKALLFSKEKELLAIPVNNYEEDFEIEGVSQNYETMIEQYTNYNKSYISEGYFVYKINLTEGFKLKGVINHEKQKNYRYYYGNTKLLRGLYIDNNLYTISEDYIKVNNLEDLKEISSLSVKEEKED